MNTETAKEYLRLCREAARRAANGRRIDLEEVSQELMLWILMKKSVKSPEQKNLPRLLEKKAKQILWEETHEHNPLGWTGCPLSVEDIRYYLSQEWEDLPDRITDALASPRMPERYRTAIESRYRDGITPSRGSTDERVIYTAIDRLQEIVNYPLDLEDKPAEIALDSLTEDEEGLWSIAIENDRRERLWDNHEAGRREDLKKMVLHRLNQPRSVAA